MILSNIGVDPPKKKKKKNVNSVQLLYDDTLALPPKTFNWSNFDFTL